MTRIHEGLLNSFSIALLLPSLYEILSTELVISAAGKVPGAGGFVEMAECHTKVIVSLYFL